MTCTETVLTSTA